MIRKSLLCLSVLAVAACSRAAKGPDVDYKVAAMGDSPLLQQDVEVSPDGTHLAYSMQVEGLSAIYVSNADGTNPVRLTRGIWDVAPKWSPDGRWIAYYSDHNADVWMVPSAGGESRQLTSGPARDNPLGWLRDGSGVILQRRGAGDDQLLVAPLDGGPVRPLFAAPAGNVYGYPSPDGSNVAFILSRAGRSTLWVQNMTGGPVRQLTTEGFEDVRLVRMWSPDGKQLLYTSGRTGTTDLWIANVETGQLRQLTDDIHNDWGGTWSPDGRWVLFYSDRGGQQDLWVVAAEGGPARRVTADLRYENNAIWSHDGRTITYASQNVAVSLDAMPAEGGTKRTLVALDGYGLADLTLSPDGRTALFSSNRGGNQDIWSVPVAGGASVPRTTAIPSGRPMGSRSHSRRTVAAERTTSG